MGKKNNIYPSVGEYPIYDTECYDFMEKDSQRCSAYIKAISKSVKNKRVLDIGAGELS